MKRIMVHCSTNDGTSNFGDVLFARMVHEFLTTKGCEVAFYDTSPYVEEYLYNVCNLKKYSFSLEEASAVIYFAGGYFGEQKKTKIDRHFFDRHLRHYKRFMSFGKKSLKFNKKMAVIGIGAGDYLWKPSQKIVSKVCNHASYVTTRDVESTNYLRSIGVENKIYTCSDVAQTFDINRILNVDCMIEPEYSYIFLHVNTYPDVSRVFVEGMKDFVNENQKIKVIVGADCCCDNSNISKQIVKELGEEKVIPFKYSTPDELCYILNKCDLVLTSKLHVGILSATFGSSVIAFPKHEKIRRYYKQIGESDRCVEFLDATPEIIDNMAKKYYKKGIVLSNTINELANENWEILNTFVNEIS